MYATIGTASGVVKLLIEQGKAVQVEPMKPMLKASGTKALD